MSARFVCIAVEADGPEWAERAAAEAYAAGATGLEERNEGVTRLLLYAPVECAAAVGEALARLAGPELRVAEGAAVAEVDWGRAWQAGLEASVISPRLAVHPSSVAYRAGPEQATLVIDPGQAFGTGHHASTRLALEGLDALAADALAGAQLLDVGCGTGVLALAALRLGAGRAVAFDIDPLAAQAARDNARRNQLADGVSVFCGGFDALAAPPFDVVVANLIRSECLPLLRHIATATRPGGVALFSGLLAEERAVMESALRAVGLAPLAARDTIDTTGDHWLALLTRREASPATP